MCSSTSIKSGLSNLGNTCFLNSVLQCLTYTPPLAAYLETGQHTTICQEGGFCAMCALQEHIRQALASPGGVISPTYIVKNLRCISKSFRPWRQEDAHEYMRYLIESLDNSCTSAGRGERGVRGAGAQSSSSSSSSSPQHPSLIQQMFGGQLRSQVKCTVCSTCSNTYDPLLDLSLEIVRADSLTKALNRFTAVEALEGDNQYHCATCKQKVCALKQFTIDKSPIVLTIQFKRFSASGSSSGGKIDKKIDFGRTLAMRPYISNPEDSDANYSLYAVLVHAGWSTHSGHYYCFVRTSGGLWHNLDDSRVRQVSEKTVLEQKAYILFYIRDPPESAALSADPPSSSSPTTRSWLSDGANGDPDRIVGGVEEFPSSSSCTRPSDCGVYRNNNNNNNNSHAYLDGSRRDVGCSSAGRLSLLRPASKPAPGWRI
ncbi:ubiquitin carboxyl-terminal hydrolase 23 isoform X2 [Physcomitrium patens]|uniref:ubiquitin carboxyl-terminal hydrolase 23 isoform X2 n=1 Tax=Physcomitrium patens TaxID=3218 RepID=UPI000D1742DA|nr:ubiquitin carboxyl-terminal hydrolase 23-like isoform X2 [Physcomitrium patens]|eukprot:XP_024359797.1 ubiquitin carboxyl-terminal hydrolase 23-like isoform X2 [Physcomitrella patens]